MAAKKGDAKRKDGRSNGGVIQSVARALGILELFDENRPMLSTAEVARLAELNRATAYRFCQTLLKLGYLEEAGQGLLRPGLKAVSLARVALGSRELPELALPHLRDLQVRTGETVNMALLDGNEIVYVARLLSDHILTLRLYVGSRLPAWSTSMGRAILAFMPEEEIEAVLAGSRLEANTERTITDPKKLGAELRRIRSRGYAINDQELVLGLWGVAAPIFDSGGKPIAAINISIPHPVNATSIESELAPEVVNAARSISDLAARLGTHAT